MTVVDGGGASLVVDELMVDYGYGPVVERVSFEVEPGEILALVGPNGAGKTSALRAIAGFVTSEGQVREGGTELSTMRAYRRSRHGVHIVPDDRGLFPALTIRDHLWLACEGWRRPKRSELSSVFELFPVLESRLSQKAQTLSGGEQQMLTMAMALMARPRFLLVDEMSTGLAPMVVQRLFELLRQVAERENIGIVIVEQYVNEVLQISDRAVVMVHGGIALEGRASELLTRMEDVTAAYFGTKEAASGPEGADKLNASDS